MNGLTGGVEEGRRERTKRKKIHGAHERQTKEETRKRRSGVW